MSEKNENENEKEKKGEPTTLSQVTINTTPDKALNTQPKNLAKETEKHREITTKEAYFASLNEWVKRANISQNAMTMFPWYIMSSYPQLLSPPSSGNLTPVMGLHMPTIVAQNTQPPLQPLNGNNLNATTTGDRDGNGFGWRILNDQAQAEMISRTGGYEYIVAPFWKRAIAEVIDMVIMLFFKIVIIFAVTNIFGYNLLLNMDTNILNKAIDNEDLAEALLYSVDMLSFSSDLLAFEIISKLCVCLYEAIMTKCFNGATIGKYVMGLSVKYVEAGVVLPNNDMQVQPVPPIQFGFQATRGQMRALLFPAVTPSLKRAFVRAVAKNVVLVLFFPLVLLVVFFKNNRTAYDIVTKTIVVETPSQPLVLRRHPQRQQQ